MGLKKIVEGAYLVPLGMANAVLLDGGPELALVDAGFPDKASLVFDAIRQLGRTPRDLRHLISRTVIPTTLAARRRSFGKPVRPPTCTRWTPLSPKLVAPPAPLNPAPGLLPRTAFRFVWRPQKRMEPVRIDRHIVDGETLPIAGRLHAVRIPGHCEGQVAFLWQGERLLLAGEVGMNILGLGDPVGFEDIEEGRRIQRKLV